MSQVERDFFQSILEDLQDTFIGAQQIVYKIGGSYEWMTLKEKKRFQQLLISNIEYLNGFIK